MIWTIKKGQEPCLHRCTPFLWCSFNIFALLAFQKINNNNYKGQEKRHWIHYLTRKPCSQVQCLICPNSIGAAAGMTRHQKQIHSFGMHPDHMQLNAKKEHEKSVPEKMRIWIRVHGSIKPNMITFVQRSQNHC